MLTVQELLRALLVPVIVATVIGALGRWRRWAWAMPVAAGAGFLTGYALLGLPKLPPRDGTDWLFWLAVPITLLGVLDAVLDRRWGWALGAAAGAVALLIVWPLVPGGASPAAWWGTALALAVAGALLVLMTQVVETRIGTTVVLAALCIALAGAGVVVLSSNLRAVGTYGLAAAAALGPVMVFAGRLRVGRSVAIVSIPVLAGLLVGGHYYPDPGVTWTNFTVLMASPVLLLLGAAVPGKSKWVRGAVGVLAVTAAVAAVTVPTAIAAKKAAETDAADPYR